MSNKDFDACGHCCAWFNNTEGKSPYTVRDTYPKMMEKVLKHKFGMPKKAAKLFIRDACYGNWKRLHETDIEKLSSAEDFADALRYEVFYCSDRWSWDRAMRVQWLYQRLTNRCRWRD